MKNLKRHRIYVYEQHFNGGNGNICPVCKKGNTAECANHRGIMLLNVPYKIISIMLLKKIDAYPEKILNKYLCGFRNGKGTTDQIFIVRHIIKKCLEFKNGLQLLFSDYRQAFDSLKRSGNEQSTNKYWNS